MSLYNMLQYQEIVKIGLFEMAIKCVWINMIIFSNWNEHMWSFCMQEMVFRQHSHYSNYVICTQKNI